MPTEIAGYVSVSEFSEPELGKRSYEAIAELTGVLSVIPEFQQAVTKTYFGRGRVLWGREEYSGEVKSCMMEGVRFNLGDTEYFVDFLSSEDDVVKYGILGSWSHDPERRKKVASMLTLSAKPANDPSNDNYRMLKLENLSYESKNKEVIEPQRSSIKFKEVVSGEVKTELENSAEAFGVIAEAFPELYPEKN